MSIMRRSVVLGAANLALIAAAPDTRVSVADYGAVPNGDDAGPGVARAIAALPKVGATLFFPPGRYRFRQHGGTAVALHDFERLTVTAHGATFLFEGNTSPILLARCVAPVLEGFSIDFDRPPFSQGEVLAVAPDARSFEIRVDDEFPVDGSEPIQTLGTYDRASGLTARHGLDYYGVGQSSTLLRPQTLRIATRYPVPGLQTRDVVVLRHNVYGNHCIVVNGCTAPVIRDVGIHAGGGMGVVGSRNSDVTIERLQIMPTPARGRLMSVCADGVHLGQGSGTVTIADCLMAGMGDDGINVNNRYLRIVERRDDRTLVVGKYRNQSFDQSDAPTDPTRFALVAVRTLTTIGEALAIAGQVAGDRATLRFQSDLPRTLLEGDMLSDLSANVALTVSRCVFPGNRARGVLAHSNATIEGCRFANQTHSAVLLAPDLVWLEGAEAAQVRIVDNEMIDVQRSGSDRGAVCITVGLPQGSSAGLVNHDIYVQRNHIVGPGPALVADHVRQLSVIENRIERTDGPAIRLGPIRDATLAGNVCTPAAPVLIDPANLGAVKLAGNQGLQA